MLDYEKLAQGTSRRKATLQSKVAATRESLEAMERELRLLDGILKALPKGAPMGSTGSPATRRRAVTPSRGKPRGKWRPGSPGRKPKWYLEQEAAMGDGKPARKAARKSGRAGRVVPGRPTKRANRPPSEKQLAALAKARAGRAAKRTAENATPEVAE